LRMTTFSYVVTSSIGPRTDLMNWHPTGDTRSDTGATCSSSCFQ
jgi:hypothetical protein